MAIEPEDWDLCRAFLAVMRSRSLSGAARALGLTQPTLGRQVAALEAQLGVALFTRSRLGLKPTPAALDLLPQAESMANAWAAIRRAASGEAGEERGTVRLTASELMSAEVLPPMLARFHAAHPGIAIELAPTDRLEDLLARESDLAVRMVAPTQPALVARHIGPVPLSLYAHRSYVARRGVPRSIEEFAGHSVIGYDRSPWAIGFLAAHNLTVSRDSFSLRTDSEMAQLGALRAGYGIGGCQDALARRDPELVAVMPGAIRMALDLWLAMHEDLRGSRRVRLLFQHLTEELTAYLKTP
jgi:DNA-binding transcriptional LysR family regulator